MKSMLAIVAVLAFAVPAWAQQEGWAETRFHRITLRNGNFIDGTVISDKPNEVTLLLKAGEMNIRRDQIEKVELIKMRTWNEKPIIISTPKAASVPKAETSKPPVGTSVQAVVETRRKVEALIKKVQMMPGDSKQFPPDEVAALGDDGIDYLVSLLPKMDQLLKTLAAFAIVALKTPKSEAILTDFVASPNAEIRLAAVSASGNLDEAARVKLLKPLAKDADPKVRNTVLGMMRGVEDRDWYEIACELINDQDREVRVSAMGNAGRLTAKFGEDDYVRALMIALKGSDDQKCDAVIAFGGLGKIEQWNVVSPLLGDAEPKVRAAAAQALMTLGALDSGPAIMDQMSREKDKWARIYMAGAIQKIRYAKAVPVLIEWLADPEVEVVNVTEMTLRALTNQDLGRERDKWQAWYDKNR